jgi:hypothetical protein
MITFAKVVLFARMPRDLFQAVKVDPRDLGLGAFRFVWAYDSCFFEWILILCDPQTWNLMNMTPEEAFTEVKHVVDNSRYLGC